MRPPAFDARALAAIDRLAVRELDDTGVPGLSVALTGPGGPVEVRAYGLADIGAEQPVEPGTLFEIGSIGKAFTAIVLLQLAEEGRLALDDPVQAALPWFDVPVVGRPITHHDLLTHTAGITSGVDMTPEARFQVWALRHRRPGSVPGDRFHYSNVGFKALGLVIEAVEGRPYPEVVRSRILEPLGMAATEAAITSAIRPRLAVGYDYLHDDRIGFPGRPLAPANWLETDTADGSIASTSADMAAFARMLLRRGQGPSGALVSGASFARMTGPHARPAPGHAYGYGYSTRVVDGRTITGHAGGMVGYVAGLQVDEAAGLAAVVLENGVMGRPMALARAILAAGRGEPDGPTAPAGMTVPRSDVAGLYRVDGAPADSEAVGSFEVVVGRDGLSVRLAGRSVALHPIDEGRFVVGDPELDRFALRFEPPDGRAVVAWHGSRRFVRDGVSAPPASPGDPALATLAGHYRSHNPWTTNFRVIARGSAAWLAFPAAPDGFQGEQVLVPLPDGSFRVGEDPAGPEDLRFDTVVDGRPLRARLSGCPYYRVD